MMILIMNSDGNAIITNGIIAFIYNKCNLNLTLQ